MFLKPATCHREVCRAHPALAADFLGAPKLSVGVGDCISEPWSWKPESHCLGPEGRAALASLDSLGKVGWLSLYSPAQTNEPGSEDRAQAPLSRALP